MKHALFLAGAAALMSAPALSAPVPATPPAAAQEASIPFANSGSINDWQDAGDSGLYVQDTHRRWYYAKLMGPCLDLPFATRIGFDVRGGSGTFDRFSSIIVKGHRCPLSSLVASGPPPSKAKKRDKTR